MSRLIYTFICVLFIVCIISMLMFMSATGLPPHASSGGLEYKDLVSILLTAIGLLLALLAAFLAVAAIWGYNTIKDEVLKTANAIAEDAARTVARQVASDAAARYMRERFDQVGPGGLTSGPDYNVTAGEANAP